MAKWLLGSWMLVMACAGIGTANAQTVEYIHTDALGTPVAVTDINRNVIERSEYEPYGAVLNRPISDGPGYTGHVMDAATGLAYMQQRYYDPTIGRFLSVDPVTADSNTGGNFNRYWYANNNPYRFTDPDGRQARPGDRGAAYIGESVSGVDVNSAESLGMANIPRSWQEPSLGKVNVGPLGRVIRSQVDSEFEKKAFDRYWTGGGDVTITGDEFADIVNSAAGLPVLETFQIGTKNGSFIAHKFDFYSNEKYNAGLGSAWIIYGAGGLAVGLYDRYDFNSKPWGVRSIKAELQTRAVQTAGYYSGAAPYQITYGTWAELP